jgi:hypothetical protein
MPAGIPKRLTDELSKLGYELTTYDVMGATVKAFDEYGDYTPVVYSGIEIKHRDRLVGVAEMEPRGWGGDNKWRTYTQRTPDGTKHAVTAHSIHNRQRDAIASLIRWRG